MAYTEDNVPYVGTSEASRRYADGVGKSGRAEARWLQLLRFMHRCHKPHHDKWIHARLAFARLVADSHAIVRQSRNMLVRGNLVYRFGIVKCDGKVWRETWILTDLGRDLMDADDTTGVRNAVRHGTYTCDESRDHKHHYYCRYCGASKRLQSKGKNAQS